MVNDTSEGNNGVAAVVSFNAIWTYAQRAIFHDPKLFTSMQETKCTRWKVRNNVTLMDKTLVWNLGANHIVCKCWSTYTWLTLSIDFDIGMAW